MADLKTTHIGIDYSEDNLCNQEPKTLSWQKENHASKHTPPRVGHTFSAYKGLSLSLVAAGAPWASPCLLNTAPASNTLPPAVGEVEKAPSEFRAAKAPLVEDIAQGEGSVAALSAVGALVEAASGAH